MKICGKMIKKHGMPETRPCFREENHVGVHAPDLSGLKNVFGFVEILERAPNGVYADRSRTRWWVLDKFATKRIVTASDLFRGNSTGERPLRDPSIRNVVDDAGKVYPEYATVVAHFNYIFNARNKHNQSYKNVLFFDGWNPRKGGQYWLGVLWIREHLGPKPGPDYQMHVLKTREYPLGFFGPGGIAWRHKMDRHDKDVLDLVAEWPNNKWLKFVESENNRRKQ